MQYDLALSLEELYRGCIKQVVHTRRVQTELGEVNSEQRTLTIDVKPGIMDGTTFVFQG